LPLDGVLTLGKRLAAELGLDRSCDTLARWMAHYIAELIHSAESAGDQDRPAAMDRCARAILELWEHRHVLPDGSRPFEAAEPLLRAVQSLDPDSKMPRWFRQVREAATDAETDGDAAQQWLDFAAKIDETARMLISWVLASASEAALDPTREWVLLAKEAGLDGYPDVQVIRLIINNSATAVHDDAPDDNNALLEERLERLEAFCGAAVKLKEKLRKELVEKLPP